jgi:HEAT repeat protein
MSRVRAGRLWPVALIVVVVLLAGLGWRLSDARTPDIPGDRADRVSRSNPSAADRDARKARAKALAETLKPPDLENIPLAPPGEDAGPGIPRTPEIDRLSNLAGKTLGERLRRHFDLEEYVHGGEPPPFERIEVSAETLDTLLGLLESENAAVRRDAAIRLAVAVLRPEDLPLVQTALERELRDANQQESRHAALAMTYALAAQGERYGTARLESILTSGERAGDDDFRREAVIVLGMIGDPESSPVLRDMLRTDPNKDTRSHAAQGLGQLGGDENRLALVDSMARDDVVEVRAWATLGYGRAAATDGSQAQPLWNASASDPEPLIRAAGNYALARAGGAGVSAALVDAYYADGEVFPRIGALAGLTQRDHLGKSKKEFLRTEGVEYLSSVARDSDDHVAVYFTARTLGRIPGQASGTALLSIVDSTHPDWVRNEAITRIARHDPVRALPELAARLADEKRPGVRKRIEQEIRRLEKRASRGK